MLIVPFKPRFIKIANIYFCKLNPHKNQITYATFSWFQYGYAGIDKVMTITYMPVTILNIPKKLR